MYTATYLDFGESDAKRIQLTVSCMQGTVTPVELECSLTPRLTRFHVFHVRCVFRCFSQVFPTCFN